MRHPGLSLSKSIKIGDVTSLPFLPASLCQVGLVQWRTFWEGFNLLGPSPFMKNPGNQWPDLTTGLAGPFSHPASRLPRPLRGCRLPLPSQPSPLAQALSTMWYSRWDRCPTAHAPWWDIKTTASCEVDTTPTAHTPPVGPTPHTSSIPSRGSDRPVHAWSTRLPLLVGTHWQGEEEGGGCPHPTQITPPPMDAGVITGRQTAGRQSLGRPVTGVASTGYPPSRARLLRSESSKWIWCLPIW